MPERDPNEDRRRRQGAVRGLLNDVPLPRNATISTISWDSLAHIVREADDLAIANSKYSASEKAKIHTARLLIDQKHPTQALSKITARQISMCLAEYHGALLHRGKEIPLDQERAPRRSRSRR